MDCSLPSTNSTSAPGSHELPDLCDFPGNCSSKYHWSLYLLMTSLAGVTCSANLMSLVVLSRLRSAISPVLRLALMNLSLTDVIGSLAYIYHSIMSRLSYRGVEVECKVRYLFYVSMNVVTLNTLVYMSVERLLAVTAPFLHLRLDGHRVTAVALTCVWLCSLAIVASGMNRLSNAIDICIYHVLVPKIMHLMNAIIAFACILFIVCTNVGLYARARREIVLIGRTLVGGADNRRQQMADMAEKAASTTLAVVVPFAILNSPLYLLLLAFYLSPSLMVSCRSVALLTAFSTLLVVNSLCNPIIYAWKLRPVQAELRRMLPWLARRPGPEPKPVTRTSSLHITEYIH